MRSPIILASSKLFAFRSAMISSIKIEAENLQLSFVSEI
jgi:hypothetical protein